MTSSNAAFGEMMGQVKSAIDQLSFQPAMSVAADYTRYFYVVSDDEALYIGEVLQNIFTEASQLVGTYNVSAEVKTQLKTSLMKGIDDLTSGYTSSDPSKVHAALKSMRVSLSKMQFTVWHSTNPTIPQYYQS